MGAIVIGRAESFLDACSQRDRAWFPGDQRQPGPAMHRNMVQAFVDDTLGAVATGLTGSIPAQ